MTLTKPGQLRCFAAYPRCSADPTEARTARVNRRDAWREPSRHPASDGAAAACAAVAVEIRRELEEQRCDLELLAWLYFQYNAVAEPRLFVERALEMFPRLCCGLASVYAQHRLGGGSVVRGWYGGQRHTFLSCRGCVVDLTADQFLGPAVYVGRLRAPWRIGRAMSSGRRRGGRTGPQNKGMKLTKPGELRSFAAYPRCSTDVTGP